ncbi:MAG: SGNH/GDSL hydrolase family protein, partial [Planctomycetes bacterium]|nr:SGNH/GDSL hydrolase family protein [Planctomycetota bacterium]
MSSRKPLTAVALSLAACVLALEVLPRLADIPGLTRADLDPIRHELDKANIQPHPYLAYANRPNYESRAGAKRRVSHNSMGLRGPEVELPKPAGRFRIICLGGSSTYGHGPSSNGATWPARLEHHLRTARPDRDIEVVNAGCRGYSTFESLGNYAFRLSDLDPDLVLIYHTVNDMRCALYLDVQRDNTHWRAVWKDPQRSPLEASYTYLTWRRYLTDHFEELGDIGNFVIVDFG